jgi:S1-C subfamily serine protease
VLRVDPSSPAQAAGMSVGDVITGVDGRAIASFADLRDEVAARPPWSDVALTVLRGTTSLTITVTLAPEPSTTTTAPPSASTSASSSTTTSSPTTVAVP